MKKIWLISMLVISAIAETKVSVYSVPFGIIDDVSSSNYRAFEKRLENIPAQTFTLSERDTVMSADGITIILDNKEDKVENFNKLLAALYSYSKITPGTNPNAVKQAVGVLALKKGVNLD
jgi:hypothetical protein